MSDRSTSPFFHFSRRVWAVCSILVLVTLACALPGASKTATPAPEVFLPSPQAVEAQPTPKPRETLPPALVEVDPLPGSQIPAGEGFTFYFNQPMERGSVEAALQGEPALSGRFEWLDDATVRFSPDQPFAADQPVRLTFNTEARAANGLALMAPVEVNFQTAGAFQVMDRVPAQGLSEINPASAVAVTFNRPVVALGEDPAALPPAFSLQPEAQGRGEWLNTSTYIFYPDTALLGGVTYDVTIDPNLSSTDGSALDASTLGAWQFTTAAPNVQWIETTDRDRAELDQTVTITFNQPMQPESVVEHFSLTNLGGGIIGGDFTWDEEETIFTFAPRDLLARDMAYTYTLREGALGKGGTPTAFAVSGSFVTVPELRAYLISEAVMELYSGFGSPTIGFTSPLEKQAVKDLIQISPAVSGLDIYLASDGYSVYLNGVFDYSTQYTITLSDQIRDRYGARLTGGAVLTFETGPAEPSLVVPVDMYGGGSIYIPASTNRLAARLTNLSVLDLQSGPLTVEDALIINGEGWPEDWGKWVRNTWQQPLDLPYNQSVLMGVELAPGGEAPQPGLYLLHADAPEIQKTYYPRQPYMLVISRVHLTLKISEGQAFIWAVNQDTNQPYGGATVTVRRVDRDLGQCVTDERGICAVEINAVDQTADLVVASIGNPGDADFAYASSYFNTGLWYALTEQDDHLAYTYTDRPIYRPGQTVNFRVALRNRNDMQFSIPDFSQIDVRVMPPYDPTQVEQAALTTLRLGVSEYGTAVGSFELPENAAPGYYSISLDEWGDSASFQVENYRKPSFDLQVDFDTQDWQAGQDVTARISARYYFDAPAGNVKVNWSLMARSDGLYLPGNYTTGGLDLGWLERMDYYSWLGTYVANGEGVTSPDGTLAVTIPAEQLLASGLTQRNTLVLEASAVDESNFPVSKRGEANFHPASYYIGLRADSWTARATEELGFSIQAVDWQGAPSGEHAMSAIFSKVNWIMDEGGYSYRRELTQVNGSDLMTDAQGRARLAFTPAEAGSYQLTVVGEGARTELLVWVSGAGSPPWPSLPDESLRLETDQSEYEVGQTAQLRVPNPFSTPALALITVERARVMRSFVVQITEGMTILDLPLEAVDSPNVYITAVVLGNRPDGRPDFRAGRLNLPVKSVAQRLNVELVGEPQRAGPGDEVTFQIKVTDSAGKPMRGEFSLALIDKAVLALVDQAQQGIFDIFYGERPHQVRTALDLAVYSERVVAQELGRGGGGGGDILSPAARSRFEDTAAWFGAIETDAEGLASVSVRLPDNLTTWVATVRGLTVDSLVGDATIEVVTTKELLVRPVTPRFLVVGDHVRLGAIVQNNSQGSLSVDVSLEAPGFTLDDAAAQRQKVNIPAGERRRVDWWGTVEDGAGMDPIFSAQAGDLRDATHTEQGVIPVLRYSAPQTFATGGVLEEPGEELEVLSLPRTFTPTGGELKVELSPSLAATVLESLEVLSERQPDDWTEPIISRLLPNLVTYRAFKEFGLAALDGQESLEGQIRSDLRLLLERQNYDGGWTWMTNGDSSDSILTAYAMLALAQASDAGFLVNRMQLENAQNFLLPFIRPINEFTEPAERDRQVLLAYVMIQSGFTDIALESFYSLRGSLSPWAQAMLALSLKQVSPGSEQSRELISDLQGSAIRSATGAHWAAGESAWLTWSTPNYSTAVVVMALAQLDPASALLTDAVRFLVLHRRANACWNSSYETAWVLTALVEAIQATGDVQASFPYEAELNGALLVSGDASTPASAVNPVAGLAPLSDLIADSPNALRIRRGEGDGQLYYRAYLEVGQPAESAQPVERGIFISRSYYLSGQDCRAEACQPVMDAALGNNGQFITVRLTVTLPEDMYYVVVEDTAPAGTEIINPNLSTSQQNFDPLSDPATQFTSPYGGWGWWYFQRAVITDTGARWVAPYLPAGTYEISYRLSPSVAGEFRSLPARAYQYFFPEVEGSSAGGVFTVIGE